jgi:hypothetical protein
VVLSYCEIAQDVANSCCRLLYRTLSNPAITEMYERDGKDPPAPSGPSVARRCAELQRAHQTHSCIEKAAAVAVPTPIRRNFLISEFLTTPKMRAEASSVLQSPVSDISTPRYLKSPAAHAEHTLQVSFETGHSLHSVTAAETPGLTEYSLVTKKHSPLMSAKRMCFLSF